MPTKKPKKSVYLLYDFEEICGIFATRQKAFEAALAHIELLKKYSAQKASELSMGEVSFEIRQEQNGGRWIWGFTVNSKNGAPLHSRKIAVFERRLDQYHSLLERHMDARDGIPAISWQKE